MENYFSSSTKKSQKTRINNLWKDVCMIYYPEYKGSKYHEHCINIYAKPELTKRDGTKYNFTYHDKEFYERNEQQCLKVCALYTLINYGNKIDNEVYIYDYTDEEYSYVEIDNLLIAMYYNLPIEVKI